MNFGIYFQRLSNVPAGPGWYHSGGMKKSNLVREIVRQRGVEPAQAADQVDRAVSKILRALRNGQETRLPGIGTISPGKPWVFHSEPHAR